MREIKEAILVIIIFCELLGVTYCCEKIVDISTEHTIARRTEAISDVFVAAHADLDMDKAVRKGKKAYEDYLESLRWKGPVLSVGRGVNYGPSGKESYYNLDMSGVVSIMRSMGNTDEYWVREDGCKMLGDYIMVAANLNLRPRGSIVETSLGDGIVCDTGGFARKNPTQIDIAVTW